MIEFYEFTKEVTLTKDVRNNPRYNYLLLRYLYASSIIHSVEVAQANDRALLSSTTSLAEKQVIRRRIMGRRMGSSGLRALNKAISAYFSLMDNYPQC